MKFNEPGDFHLPKGIKLVKGSGLFMHNEFRAVICPNAHLVFLSPDGMLEAYADLQAWALPIADSMLNQ